jgi:hypothetical protein
MPWHRKFNDPWYCLKVNGKAQPILDADGMPVKGKDNPVERLFWPLELGLAQRTFRFPLGG